MHFAMPESSPLNNCGDKINRVSISHVIPVEAGIQL
jgi:hypothetical protein